MFSGTWEARTGVRGGLEGVEEAKGRTPASLEGVEGEDPAAAVWPDILKGGLQGTRVVGRPEADMPTSLTR